MTFPTPPVVPIPLWAETTPNKEMPPNERKNIGWRPGGEGVDYGEAPPFQWFNYLQYSYGRWITYANDCINYIKNGNIGQRLILLTTNAFYVDTISGDLIQLPLATAINYPTSAPWNPATRLFTAPESTMYKISMTIPIIAITTPGALESKVIRLVKNGVQGNIVSSYQGDPLAATESAMTFTTYIYLNTNDTLGFRYFSGQERNLTIVNETFSDTTNFFVTFAWNL